MLSCVVQNFYSETPYSTKTFRYNHLIMYKLAPYVSVFLKHMLYFHLSPKPFYRNNVLNSTYKSNSLKNFFALFKIFINKLSGTWTNNITKSYSFNSLAYLNSPINSSKLSSNSNTLYYITSFKTLSFNVSNNIS